MLTFVGLGLFDKEDISVKGLEAIRRADRVYLECYTSRLMGTSIPELEQFYHKPVKPLFREDVEQHPDELLREAETMDVVFLCAGDPMVSTTHADLRIRAAERGVGTAIIHAASISSAVCGLSGLQNYRFGKSCSLPFPQKNWFPTTPLDVIRANLAARLHTLVFLDIQNDRFMTVPEAVALLEKMTGDGKGGIPVYVGIARAGSRDPVVIAGPADRLVNADFGPPLHILIVPAELHDMEREYLVRFAGL